MLQRALPGARVAEGPGNTLAFSAELEAADPLAAATRLDEALGDALMATGLYEEFDVSRRLLHVAPADVAGHLSAWSSDFHRWEASSPKRRRRWFRG